LHERQVQRPSETLVVAAALLCAAASVAAWFFYFVLYWRHRDRFNEAGRYIDETTMVVYHEQSSLLVIPAVAVSALAVVFGYFWHAARRLHNAKRELQS
jgi:NADH:ubiquinone oxidoreductase subunit 5 (subunit L)/multisubunit Na+/H+ antiporter MnhA subunit